MDVEYSKTDHEFVKSVRGSLAEISENRLPDDTIMVARDIYVIPFIDNRIDPDKYDQEYIDRAIVAFSSLRAFNSIPSFSTVSGGGITANISVSQYRDDLTQRASEALADIDLVVPVEDGSAPIAERTDGMLR